MKKVFLAVVFQCGVVSMGFCQLQYESTTIVRQLKDDESVVTVPVNFKNIGSSPITILSVKASCGCTTTKLKSDIVKPGEEGSVEVTYTKGSSYGVQKKSIVIQTDFASDPAKRIELQFEMANPLLIGNEQSTWTNKQEAIAKTVALKVNPSYGSFNILNVQSTNDDFVVQLKTVKPKAEYQVTIKPTQTMYPAKTTIRIETDNVSPKIFYIYGQVMGP